MTSYFNRYRAYVLLIALVMLSIGCKKDSSTLQLDAEVQLTSFVINGVNGEINQRSGDIHIDLPFGSDVAFLTPVLGLPEQAVSSIEPGQPHNFTGPVSYRITNGNLYKEYLVSVKIIPPLVSFSINGMDATIDHGNKSISILLPDGTDLNGLTPAIAVQPEVTVSPATNIAQDFNKPVKYTFSKGGVSVVYQVNVISNSISQHAFLGVAPSRDMITNSDEKAAADWFFGAYPEADYVSFQSIETGIRLSNYKVIWWHFDSSQSLPEAALTPTVISALKAYRANGGNLLLTSYATVYLERLGIVPAGKGPNNVFGDFLPGGAIEFNNDWGISFRGKENHPVFKNLETFEPGKAYLLEKGTFRLNHTAWWFLPEWGGYGNGANWRQQTGGVNLASEAWDDQLDGRVGIAEWPVAGSGNTLIIAFGAYDWFSEPQAGASTTNRYIQNIRTLTGNAIDYLAVIK